MIRTAICFVALIFVIVCAYVLPEKIVNVKSQMIEHQSKIEKY